MMKKPVTVKDLWEKAWKRYGIGKVPETEYRFHNERRFRFDLAWPKQYVAVEIDGFGPGHQSKADLSKDNEKMNLAQLCGWTVLRFTARQLGSDEKRRKCCMQVIAALKRGRRRHGI